ncbi:RDD family protein [Kitasatospora sp. NPDC048722]|uniref:RDD family protein n=1 Tax=Kitasatospora sp. NPDC048722 TaxID=3155639 RepID=UPI0033DCABD8
MAQGYPPPQQYGQNPYAQPQSPQQAYPAQGYPPNPYGQQQPPPQQYQQQPPQQYGQNPYPAHGQPYQPEPAQQPQQYQQQPPQQYGQNPYPAHGQPYQPELAQQPQPAQPYAAHGQGFDAATAVPTPPETSNYRRFPAILIDFLVAIGPAFAVANKAGHAGKHGAVAGVPWIVGLLATGLVLSFVNQVLLARLTGFSVGKGVMALRVIRRKRVMHPNTWRLTRRWLLGFVVLLVSWLSEEFEGEGDIVGVRIVRWKHLREYEQATGRLG